MEFELRSWAKLLASALAALVLTALPAAAQVPDPFARELAQKLARGEQLITDNGYSRAAGPFAGGLNAAQSRRNTVTLRAGQDYRILGVCDERCRDFDLRLFGPNGALVAQDILDDAVPIVHIVPTVTGQYDIEAVMVRCGASPCWYAFNVYSR
jgi:hypothetical protein